MAAKQQMRCLYIAARASVNVDGAAAYNALCNLVTL